MRTIDNFVRLNLTLLTLLLIASGSMYGIKPLPKPMGKPPRLAVAIVIDSCSFNYYIQKLQPYFKGGLRLLLENGVNYTNAYVPHAMPSTMPGHTALNTGVFGNVHGIINNAWHDKDGKRIDADDDNADDAAVIAPSGVYDYGKSPRNIMTQGLSDSLIMESQPCAKTKVFSISIKARAAIGTANKLGKPFWFDDKTGRMTSSLYYFDALPHWVEKFNKTNCTSTLKSFRWDLLYPADDQAYCFKGITKYTHVSNPKTMIGKDLPIDRSAKDPYDLFKQSPKANQLLIDFTKACIKANWSSNRSERMLIWLCLSPLDKIAHLYGPESLEAVDMMYQLDCQLKYLIRFIQRYYKLSDVVFVLTADHGMAAIPERIRDLGYPAYRTLIPEITKKISAEIQKTLDIDIKVQVKFPNIFFSGSFNKLDSQQKERVLTIAKDMLLSVKGVKHVWTNPELDASWPDEQQLAYLYKYQRYPGRTGDLIVEMEPFSQFTKYETGTSHESPHEYCTHVPLIIYRHQFYQKKFVNSKVWTLQLANTLAQILDIPKIAASPFRLLPGIYPDCEEFL